MTVSTPIPFAPAAPEPLIPTTAPPEPYPMAALGTLAPAAAAIADITQCPPAIAAQSVLGVAALAAQGLVDAETLHGSAPASLYLLTIAESGERKSSADRLAMAPMRTFEAELVETERAAFAAWRNAKEVWEVQRKDILNNAKKANTRDAAQADLAALGPEPDPPLYASIVAAEPTVEGIVKNLARLRPALGLFSDEGGAFIGGHAMAAKHRLKTMASLSSLWDGTPIDRWRAGDGVSSFRGRRLAAHLMAQPIVAAALLSDQIARAQGFLPRFLMAHPPSRIGTRLRTAHDPGSEARLAAYATRIGDILRQTLPLRDGSRNELTPPTLDMSPEARTLLQDFALKIEAAQAPWQALEPVRPFASKAPEQAARIAAVLTVAQSAHGGTSAAMSPVTAEVMADAITLAAWYVNEALRLITASAVPPDIAQAERMRCWLLGAWREPLISAADAAQRGPFKETAKSRKALQLLQEHGWLVALPNGGEVRGQRRREVWRIVGAALQEVDHGVSV